MQISGAWSAEVPSERLARLVAASVVEHLDRVDLIGAIAAAVARHLAEGTPVAGPAEPAEAGGYALGGRHQGAGDPFYDREPEGGDQ